ncbi:TPA: hypothetical protein HA265_00570 [Candidatus Woesearchaeota archaeon]|nr:hypothetical protein [Candidatus Woesearchaeota archaeon]
MQELDLMMQQLVRDMPRIITHCKGQGLSPYDALALVEWHRLQLAEDYGVQERPPKKVLEDTLSDEQFRREIIKAGEESGTPLYNALLFMADNPDYAEHIEQLYTNMVRPMLRGDRA